MGAGQNVEVVRTFFEAFNRAAAGRAEWDETLRGAAPNVQLDLTLNVGPWRGVHVGADQVKRVFEQFVEPWETVRLDLEECFGEGDRLVTVHSGHFVGRDGIRAEIEAAWWWTFRDGAWVRVQGFNELDDALATAGLER